MNKLVEALPELLKKQAELDDYITETKGLTHEETIESRKLAFVVELAECMQEWRGFKYWSDNQEPNCHKDEECGECRGWGVVGRSVSGICASCHGVGLVNVNPLLQEYVDVLHFALSLHNHYEGDLEFVQYNARFAEVCWGKDEGWTANEITSVLRTLIIGTSCDNSSEFWSDGNGLLGVLLLGKHLNLTSGDTLQEYDRKYRINIARQENGY